MRDNTSRDFGFTVAIFLLSICSIITTYNIVRIDRDAKPCACNNCCNK